MVEELTEIPFLIEQRYAYEIQSQIACGFNVISRKDAKPAGINSDTFMDAELSAEIGDSIFCKRRSVFCCPGLLIVEIVFKPLRDSCEFLSIIAVKSSIDLVI